jgi:ABC-type Na+ efflux pump permease subunit
MENSYTENVNLPPAPLIIDLPIESFLKETIKWGKFIAIIGFVFTGIIAMVGLVLLIAGGSTLDYRFTPRFGFIVGPIYMVSALLYFFPSRFLYRFCRDVKTALSEHDQEALTVGFESLKSNFKFWGILLIVMIVFYAVVLGAAAFLFLFKA